MKKITFVFLICIIPLFLVACKKNVNNKENLNYESVPVSAPDKKVVLAYITSGSQVIPDPNLVTHINYAFGTVNREYNGVNVQNVERLKSIVSLKLQKPELKVLLSIGGWTAGGFSEMACEDSLRSSFVKSCGKIAQDLNLDGIDIDWEYPSSNEAGITAKPEDIDNFTKLMKELRLELGNDKLLTFATIASAQFIDFKAVMPYCNFVNIMAYDLGRPPFHNAGLISTSNTKNSIAEAIDAHLKAGVPSNKLVLGVPFYGHGSKEKGFPDYVDFKNISNGTYNEHKIVWDENAQVPYFVDKSGEMIITYDSPESLTIKCNYALERGLIGIMYWEYSCDDSEATLAKTVYNCMYPSNK